MKIHKLYLLFSALAFSGILFSACGPSTPLPQTATMPADGECPPGYHLAPEYGPDYCLPNPAPLDPPTPTATPIFVGAKGTCPPQYHVTVVPVGAEVGIYCAPDPVEVDLPANGLCPLGYHWVCGYFASSLNQVNGSKTIQGQACGELIKKYEGIPGCYYYQGALGGPGSTVCVGFACRIDIIIAAQGPVSDSGLPVLKPLDSTPTPPAQASNSGRPDLNPAMEVVQYCANKGGNLGGVNISFPLENTLHIEDWFSESSSHVKCVDDLSNPRSCWGPESATFDVLLCNNLIQNQYHICQTLPVTLGACTQEREDDNQPDINPIPLPCGHC